MRLANFAAGCFAVCMIWAVVTMNVSSRSIGTAVIAPKAEKAIGGGDNAIILPDNLSTKQYKLLNLAYETAKADGHKNPEILQGILLQESDAGASKSYKVAGQEYGLKTNERYYGPYQMKLATAKDVLKEYPQLRKKYDIQTDADEEIIANLIMNEHFATEMASKDLKIKARAGKGESYLIAAYNKGAQGAKDLAEVLDLNNLPYVKGVRANMAKLR